MPGLGVGHRTGYVDARRVEVLTVRLFERLRSGGVGLLLLGEPGIGKTRALGYLLDTEPARPLPVFHAVASELEVDVPFGVVTRALGLRRDSPDEQASALAGVLTGSTAADPTTVALEVMERTVDLLERWSADGPFALVLDDLQWADEASLLVVDRIARELAHLRVLLLLAARPAPRRGAVEALGRALKQGDRGEVVRLAPLDGPGSLELARSLLAAEPGPRLRRAIAATGGNPLYLVELLATVDRSDLTEEVDLADDHLPVSLREVVVQHVSSVPPVTLDVLRTASVMGTSFDLSHLALVLGRPELDVVADLQPALDAQVLTGEGAALAFAHELLRDALYDEQPAAVRAARHRAIVTTLRDAGVELTDLVPHLLRADWASLPDATATLHDAGRSMRSRSAPLAADLLRAALDAARDQPDPHLQLDFVAAATLADRAEDAAAVLAQVEGLPVDALPVGVRDRLVGDRLVVAAIPLRSIAEEEARLTSLESAGLSPTGSTQALARRAWLRWLAGDREAARRQVRAALDDVTQAGRYELATELELLLARVAEGDGDPAASMAHVRRALGHARRTSDPTVLVDSATTAVLILGTDPATRVEAEKVIQEGAAAAARTGSVLLEAVIEYAAAVHAMRWGQWDDALTRFEALVPIAEAAPRGVLFEGAVSVFARAARLHVHRGDLGRAVELVARARDDVERGRAGGSSADGVVQVHLAAMELALAAEDAEGARAAADRFRTLSRQRGIDVYELYFASELFAVARFLDDDGEARAVVERARGLVESQAPPWIHVIVDRLQAQLDGDADRLLALSADVDARGIPWEWSAQVREEAATCLAAQGRTDEAVAVLDEALQLWEDAGARRDVDRVRATLRDLGVQRGRGLAADRPESGWDALTEAEWRVVRLVAEGLIYRAIGERLFVSRRTVETHVRNVFRKLGVSSRAELAAALLSDEGGRRMGEPPA